MDEPNVNEAGTHTSTSMAQSDPSIETSRWMDTGDIRDVYADQAEWMARMNVFNRVLTGRFRHNIFSKAEGRVLDVACGTGTNRRYLPEHIDYVGIDISPDMLEEAADHLTAWGYLDATLHEMDAQDLVFPEDTFDTVISSLSTCTFPDPTEALQETSRVCKPDGRILLLEHGRSSFAPIARFQEWRAEEHYRNHACRWTQEPVETVAAAGLPIYEANTAIAGIITAIEAGPIEE